LANLSENPPNFVTCANEPKRKRHAGVNMLAMATATRPRPPLAPAYQADMTAELKGEPLRRRRQTRAKQTRSDAKLQDAYLAALPRYFTVSAALVKAGANWPMLARWREQSGEFCVREQHARETLADLLEAEAIRRAFKGVRQPVYQGGLLAGHVTSYSDALLTLLLKAMRPEKYRERSEIRVDQPIVKVVAGFDPAQAL